MQSGASSRRRRRQPASHPPLQPLVAVGFVPPLIRVPAQARFSTQAMDEKRCASKAMLMSVLGVKPSPIATWGRD